MYLTEKEYKALMEEEAPESFELLECEARAVIDRETLFRLQAGDLSSLPKNTQQSVKQAVAMQIKYLDENGGLSEVSHGKTSVSLGKYSFTAAGNPAAVNDVAPGVPEILIPTGLCYRGF